MKDDTISRAAALDFVSAMNFCGEISDEAYQKLTVHFENLPSATDTNVGGNLISRQAAIDAIQKLNIPEDMCVFEIMSHIEVEIATLPTVQPQRMKGAWINDGRIIRCNKCKTGYAAVKGMKSALTYDFCPNCGADMRCSENPNS